MNTIFIRAVIAFSATLLITNPSNAQDNRYNFGLNYTTEVQSDFWRKANWVNLVTLEGDYKPWQNGEFALQTISVWKTNKERIIDDLQTFSNIEEDNMAINVFLMGYTHRFNHVTLFGGIRNINNDYFIGQYTSLFTNSSCGIYPTLSINYPIANYPLSAMCIHGEFELSKSLVLKNSLYNGTSRELFSKDAYPFTVNPKKDGVLNVTELSFLSKTNNYGFYTIGSVLSAGSPVYINAEQEKAEQKSPTKVNYTLWGNIEKSIYADSRKNVGILLQSSFAPRNSNDCTYYYGGGVILNSVVPAKNENTLGVFWNRAIFKETAENTLEVTWKYNVNNRLAMQPAFHCITTGSTTKAVGLLRFSYNLK